MDLEYDNKFDEMKKYIPFLENMIKRLENNSSASNPRQAQLNKIRSLRDLLLDKKKRMKMENLLKCEQVLINLHAKVEQRDSLSSPALDAKPPDKDRTSLNVVRNKLKSVVSKLKEENIETLPEIARASITEEVCEPGSKEPALFQRRPHKPSKSPNHTSSEVTDTSPQSSKRNYTRVLLSPEPSKTNWTNDNKSPDKPLFSRRSPRRSPRRISPVYQKKERKKIKQKSRHGHSNDLNIRLKVPEESLSSLNTKDILSRIINCSDKDVDIATLRELRTQILGELKQTGSKEDISDLILRSYKSKDKKGVKREEVEEGELSDSESEAIESIYGSLVIMEKEEPSVSAIEASSDKERPRKIQICLVINADKNNGPVSADNSDKNKLVDISDFENFSNKKETLVKDLKTTKFDIESTELVTPALKQEGTDVAKELPPKEKLQIGADVAKESPPREKFQNGADVTKDSPPIEKMQKELTLLNFEREIIDAGQKEIDISESTINSQGSKEIHVSESITNSQILGHTKNEHTTPEKYPSNDFNKVVLNETSAKDQLNCKNKLAIDDPLDSNSNVTQTKKVAGLAETLHDEIIKTKTVEIPLLDLEETAKKDVESEIDILQALKNEILNETASVLSSETVTPLLHQPKITRVTNAQEIGCKKRISIEKYKAQSINASSPLYMYDSKNTKDDLGKKQSLKLTEKECERFNLYLKEETDQSSEDESKSSLSIEDIYGGLAPKSPDHDDFADTGLKPPVIIPNDPVNKLLTNCEMDIDMRKILPNTQQQQTYNYFKATETSSNRTDIDLKKNCNEKSVPLIDPRIKRDLYKESPNPNVTPETHRLVTSCGNLQSNDLLLPLSSPSMTSSAELGMTLSLNPNMASTLNSSVTPTLNPSMTPTLHPSISSTVNPHLTPNLNPSMTPCLIPNMTPNRANIMTPNARSFEVTPSRIGVDSEDYPRRKHVYAPMFTGSEIKEKEKTLDSHNYPWIDNRKSYWEDRDLRSSSVQKEDYQEKLFDRYGYDKRDAYSMIECPPTPSHAFGRIDCPSTPTPSFGRNEMPMTPSHPYSRSDCPPTPTHSFGRPDSTHQFGKSDYIQRPIASHIYSRSQDPRLSRVPDYTSSHYDDRDRRHDNDRFHTHSYRNNQNSRNCNTDSYRYFHREQSMVRDRDVSNELSRRSVREQSYHREPSVSHLPDKVYESERYSYNRGYGRKYEYRNQNDSNSYYDNNRHSYNYEHNVTKPIEDRYSRTTAVRSNRHDIDKNKSSQTHDSRQVLSFEDRRRRASSVGRISENKAPREETHESKKTSINKNNTKFFRRACSVGREVKIDQTNFRDVKAELRRFKINCDKINTKKYDQQNFYMNNEKSKSREDPRSRRDIYDSKSQSRQITDYSPRKNYRDPRIRSFSRYDYRDTSKERSRNNESRNSGIVYSSDNISKGTILGSGYGVKNYKIPKIKKVSPQTETKSETSIEKYKANAADSTSVKCKGEASLVTNSKDNNLNVKSKDVPRKTSYEKDDNSETEYQEEIKKGKKMSKKQSATNEQFLKKKHKVIKESDRDSDDEPQNKNRDKTYTVDSDESIEKRSTRSSKKQCINNTKSLDKEFPLKRTRKTKRAYIYDTDDSDESSEKSTIVTRSAVADSNKKLNEEQILNIKDKENVAVTPSIVDEPMSNSEGNKELDNFSVTDLEIFTDNNATDPIIANINALIADLDNDLEVPKDLDLAKDLDAAKDLDTSNNIDASKDVDSSKYVGSSKDVDSLKDVDSSKGVDLSKDVDASNILDVSKDSVAPKYLDALKDLDASKHVEASKDLEASKRLDASINFSAPKNLNTSTDLRIPKVLDSDKNPRVSYNAVTTSDEIVGNEIYANKNNDENTTYPMIDNSSTCQKQAIGTVETETEQLKVVTEDAMNVDLYKKDREKIEIRNKSISPEISIKDQTQLLSTVNKNTASDNENIDSNMSVDYTETLKVKKDALPVTIASTPKIDLIQLDNNTPKQETKKDINIKNDLLKDGRTLINKPVEKETLFSHNIDENSSNEIVSTSETESVYLNNSNSQSDTVAVSTAPPDSTIIMHNIECNPDNVPDSTGGGSCSDLSNDISSTNIISDDGEKDNAELTSSRTDIPAQINSIGTLLSFLQDKSKINELLSKLSDESLENEKIRKKLEKLSRIVSEDDDMPAVENEQKTVSENYSKSREQLEQISDKNINSSKEEQDMKNNLIKLDNDITSFCDKNVGNSQYLQSNENKQACLEETTKDSNAKANIEMEEETNNDVNTADTENLGDLKLSKSNTTKKSKVTKKGKGKVSKTKVTKVRITRSDKGNMSINKPSVKTSRELKSLHDDLREMFSKDDVLGATGIRMCRLAKVVDDNKNNKIGMSSNETEPVVILEKWKKISENNDEAENLVEKQKKTTKEKSINNDNLGNKQNITPVPYKPGPKSKTKLKGKDFDPYNFDNESAKDIDVGKRESSSDSDKEFIDEGSNTQVTNDNESSQVLVDVKKKTRKRSSKGWKAGIIRPKNKKKKANMSPNTSPPYNTSSHNEPDLNSFTDKVYCFEKNVSTYKCRLCSFSGFDIVSHYKIKHPHSEIPLSRINPLTAEEAIKQCQEVNFQSASKIPSPSYVCRFCFKDIGKKQGSLEAFFWHVVSMHTGEYKHSCPECSDEKQCPFNIDIPPPPKATGQLLGYICGKCNFTQISLENLKTHVIVRHMDERTEVFTVNLAEMPKKKMSIRKLSIDTDEPRVLRSRRSHQNIVETSATDNESTDDSDDAGSSNEDEALVKLRSKPNMKSKLTFENETIISEETKIKTETDLYENKNIPQPDKILKETCEISPVEHSFNPQEERPPCNDVFDYPHFKIVFTKSGSKEYVCCINGVENHYKTALLISLKKHVQIKHSEVWDGYCFVCKVIVTPQGNHNFRDCLQHFIDTHMDNFPILEQPITDELQTNIPETLSVPETQTNTENEEQPMQKPYINVRPLSQLISTENPTQIEEDSSILPVIESVVSLGSTIEQSVINFPTVENIEEKTNYNYEEAQAHIMSNKQHVIRELMLSRPKLAHIFKCAGRFCSYSTDRAEDALLHASTHIKVGGENALCCAYCDFDSHGDAIELINHVFKVHGSCQYFCAYCFYRAAAIQLVHAHITRLHPSATVNVLRTSIVTAAVDDNNSLTREQAVPYYLCSDIGCEKFRTFTPGKYFEHLRARHSNRNSHPCFICQLDIPTATDYVRHLKTHGMRLYQCTWCVFGADTESDLLAHASAVHPTKQPKAYLRIITNKEGTNELRVLPMAQFNKCQTVAVDVTPSAIVENPLREADKSIQLGKIIGETTHMIDLKMSSMVSRNTGPESSISTVDQELSSNLNYLQPLNVLAPSISTSPKLSPMSNISPLSATRISTPPLLPSRLSDSPLLTNRTSATQSVNPGVSSPSLTPGMSTPPLSLINTPRISTPPALIPSISTPPALCAIVKTDQLSPSTSSMQKESSTLENSIPETKPNIFLNSDIIYCLDSDEEEPNTSLNIVNLSDDERINQEQPVVSDEIVKMPYSQIFRCSKCSANLKTGSSLRKHFSTCFSNTASIPCSYCSDTFDLKDVINHYLSVHLRRKQDSARVACGICPKKFSTQQLLNEHITKDHDNMHIPASTKRKSSSDQTAAPNSSQIKNRPGPKSRRKQSFGSKEKIPDSTFKIKKYGPQDIDKLPINPILDDLVYCSLCEFKTKVRLNMVRHLQLHAEQQPVPQTAPVNPVPHLETNERHFDKMVNLASSSLVTRTPDKTNKNDNTPTVTLMIPPELAARYPKFVPERQRHTCGAKGCSYISLDETMLKCHWEALHAGTTDYHCVHCPPHQHLDTSRPLTAARIIGHLKMHDVKLYACSLCPYYHYKIQILEKHLKEVHKGGKVMVVREESSTPPVSNVQSVAAPTMDLKPWQCGLCQFKSLLQPEVVDHCAKVHNSKMQYKCAYCAFRTSNLENIPKHQAKSHSDKPEEIFYYYYREGSILNNPDGTPLWEKQRQKAEPPKIKSESVTSLQTAESVTQIIPPVVNLDIVKKEVIDTDDTKDNLCKEFGQFCEPNGLKYKCALCNNVTEDKLENMESHLYEELQYRKWSCSVCSYKAFHKAGFSDHMQSEHRLNREPIELKSNIRIEKWVTQLLAHQTSIIQKNKENLAKQKIEIMRTNLNLSVSKNQKLAELNPTTAIPGVSSTVSSGSSSIKTTKELHKCFGPFGAAVDTSYCCPKCQETFKEENEMQIHLENELNKIRWLCNNCTSPFQNYHDVQFHCRSEHQNLSSRPIEATRDPAIRSSWVKAVIKKQKNDIETVTKNTQTEVISNENPTDLEGPENSLLVVRYEERVPTPETVTPLSTTESDADKTGDDDPKKNFKNCPHCSYITIHVRILHDHILRHYGLKPYICEYCGLNGYKKFLEKHQKQDHPGQPINLSIASIPPETPSEYQKKASDFLKCSEDVSVNDEPCKICIVCRKVLTELESKNHHHDGLKPYFGKKGDVVVKCCNCSMLQKNVNSYLNHHKACHPGKGANYVFFKLNPDDDKTIKSCSYCSLQFTSSLDINNHIATEHNSDLAASTSQAAENLEESENLPDTENILKRKRNDEFVPNKRVARKSTAKLPSQFAKKSTTKLPFTNSSDEEYTFYGTQTPTADLSESILIPFGNTRIPVTLKKVPEVFGNPVVQVKKMRIE